MITEIIAQVYSTVCDIIECILVRNLTSVKYVKGYLVCDSIWTKPYKLTQDYLINVTNVHCKLKFEEKLPMQCVWLQINLINFAFLIQNKIKTEIDMLHKITNGFTNVNCVITVIIYNCKICNLKYKCQIK